MRSTAPTWRPEPTLRFLAMLPLALAACGLVLELAARALALPPDPRPAWFMAAGTGLIHVAALGMVAVLLRVHAKNWRDAFGLFAPGWSRRLFFAAVITLPALVGAWVLHQGSAWLLEFFHFSAGSQASIDAIRGSTAPWERGLILVFASITAPVTEEILFRGILGPLLRELISPVASALVTTLVFAAIHANAAAFLPLCLLGLCWTWLYERTGDLGAPILSHALFNLINFAWIVLSPPS